MAEDQATPEVLVMEDMEDQIEEEIQMIEEEKEKDTAVADEIVMAAAVDGSVKLKDS